MTARLAPLTLLLAGAIGVDSAAAVEWTDQLARTFSGRYSEIENELASIETELPGLPALPIDDQGGTGGFASVHPSAEPQGDKEYSVTVKWTTPGPIDLVALVPPRRYDVDGLRPQFGTPDSFTVELIDADGVVVAELAREQGVWKHPVRAGHPFLYPVEPPVEAAGMKVTAQRLPPDSDGGSGFIHAWAELFAFSGDRNLALGSEVTTASGIASSAPWHWNKPFLVDGQTPLGLPELPVSDHRNIGWLSKGGKSADQLMFIELSLKDSRPIDGLRLFPAKRPTSDLPSGFGFPRRMRITVSDKPLGNKPPADGQEIELRNPGHNPVLIPLEPQQGRFVRIEATRLWKSFDSYPAFFALSEVEVLEGGQNVARGSAVRSPDGMGNVIATGGRSWSAMSLTDGHGPDGKLVPPAEWLTAIDQRLDLETRRHRLRLEAASIVARWNRIGLATVAILGMAGAFLLIALPIRYRVREKRQLREIRERIAGDLHDEVGSNLGSIQMFADLAEGHEKPADELKRIQRIAAETVSAVRDIVWLLRPTRAHRIGTAEHLRETSSIMLEPLEWEFTANEQAWQCELPDESSRHLFLFFREALHNALRHSGASRVTVHVEQSGRQLVLKIADDGCGIDPQRLERPATLRALRQRAEALRADLEIDTAPGQGTRLELKIPLGRK